MRVQKPIGFDSWPELEKRKWLEEIDAEQQRFALHVKNKFKNIKSSVVVPPKPKKKLVPENVGRELAVIRAIFGSHLEKEEK